MGHDLVPFSPRAVETLSHGLIGCMDERASDFQGTNLPIIGEMLSAASLSFKRHYCCFAVRLTSRITLRFGPSILCSKKVVYLLLRSR